MNDYPSEQEQREADALLSPTPPATSRSIPAVRGKTSSAQVSLDQDKAWPRFYSVHNRPPHSAAELDAWIVTQRTDAGGKGK